MTLTTQDRLSGYCLWSTACRLTSYEVSGMVGGWEAEAGRGGGVGGGGGGGGGAAVAEGWRQGGVVGIRLRGRGGGGVERGAQRDAARWRPVTTRLLRVHAASAATVGRMTSSRRRGLITIASRSEPGRGGRITNRWHKCRRCRFDGAV